MPDLVIRNALHDRTGQRVDVAVTGGVITAIAPDGVGPGDREIDAADAMVSPALIESHFHLENALLWDGAINQSGTLDEAIRLYAAIKRDLTPDDILRRASLALRAALANGVLWMRNHVDIDRVAGVRILEAILPVRERFKDLIDVQVIAFPQHGMARDPEVVDLVAGAVDPHRERLSRVVGETRTALNRNSVLEATMDNLLLQAICDATGTQMAFSNGWRYGAPVPPGPVTANDLWNIIPVNPPVSTVEVTGQELRAMMEENLERTFARDPYQQMGGYVKRCMGVKLYCKLENPPGLRIQEFFAGGRRLDPDAVYRAAFVTGQGVPAKYGKNRENLDIRAIEALERYLSRGPASAELRGSVMAI